VPAWEGQRQKGKTLQRPARRGAPGHGSLAARHKTPTRESDNYSLVAGELGEPEATGIENFLHSQDCEKNNYPAHGAREHPTRPDRSNRKETWPPRTMKPDTKNLTNYQDRPYHDRPSPTNPRTTSPPQNIYRYQSIFKDHKEKPARPTNSRPPDRNGPTPWAGYYPNAAMKVN